MTAIPPAGEIIESFAIDGALISVTPLGRGHIHQTWCSRFERGGQTERYVHQRINRSVFDDPARVMQNIERVTAHITGKMREAGVELNVAMATNYLETLHMLVATGLGWSLLPATVLDEEVQQITVDGMRLSRRLGAVTHKKRSLSNAGNAMIRTCLEA